MLNFSQKAAKRFRLNWSELDERSGDFWKVDIDMFGHVPLLMIVHEYTLFTLVRRKAPFKTPLDITPEIRQCCPWYRYVGQPTLGRNSDKRITGTITQMKREIGGLFSPAKLNAIERHINSSLYSCIAVEQRDYGKPLEAVDGYVKGHMPWLDRKGPGAH